ncbi:MAG: hypothetical protein JWM04_511 [Verrucomicrobiales bacterium]|nr:hypothetical protein [Verrucomicrobiales bacterium]
MHATKSKQQFVKNRKLRRCDRKESTWYYAQLAFLIIPWKCRLISNPTGILLKRIFLIQANNIESAFNKAHRILAISEHTDRPGILKGSKVIVKKIGILELDQINDEFQSGAEVFDETEPGKPLAEITKQIISTQKQIRLIAYEKKHGKLPLLPICYGEEFDQD